MKNIILFLLILTVTISCKAQNIVPLNHSRNQPNYTYYKDLDNGLPQFVGIWQATVNGKTTRLRIDYINQKLIELLGDIYYRDVLIVRYEIKDGQGNILESNWNESLDNYKIISHTFNVPNNRVRLGYEGGQCGVGEGLITMRKIDATHLIWDFNPNSSVVTSQNCPNYPSGGIPIHLPYEPDNIVFTKQ